MLSSIWWRFTYTIDNNVNFLSRDETGLGINGWLLEITVGLAIEAAMGWSGSGIISSCSSSSSSRRPCVSKKK